VLSLLWEVAGKRPVGGEGLGVKFAVPAAWHQPKLFGKRLTTSEDTTLNASARKNEPLVNIHNPRHLHILSACFSAVSPESAYVGFPPPRRNRQTSCLVSTAKTRRSDSRLLYCLLPYACM
jgi:hypothetical protein